jgi:hypothetical protein
LDIEKDGDGMHEHHAQQAIERQATFDSKTSDLQRRKAHSSEQTWKSVLAR